MSTPAGGTLYLIIIQVASRGLTFIGNQVLLRYTSPTLLGIAVQLELVSVTILYFARESLRVALQRQPPVASTSSDKSKEKQTLRTQSQAVVNLSYLAVGLGLLIAIISGSWYRRVADIQVLQSPQFTEAFYVYGAATLIEVCAEPFFVVIQQHALYKERAGAETSGAIARCICACATAYVSSRQGLSPSVLPFAVGQFAYSISLFGFYFLAACKPARRIIFSLIPQSSEMPSSTYFLSLFSKPIFSLATTMYVQSIFKLLLTEGDRLILAFLSSLADQGAFALAANYGGLLARLVFQPIEESSRNTFGRLLSSPTSTSTSNKTSPTAKNTSNTNKRDTSTNIKIALTHLSTTLRFYILFALPLLTFLPPLIPHLAPLILGSRWRNPTTTALLSIYIYYIPFLAVNGILDSFVTSVATPSQLRAQSLWMAGFTVVYGGMCWFCLSLLKLGSAGLVWGNVSNMILRIAWGGWFVDRWIGDELDGEEGKRQRGKFWRESLRPLYCAPMAVLVGIWLSVSIGINKVGDGTSRRILPGLELDVVDVAKVGFGLLLLGGTIWLVERSFLLSIARNVVPKRIAEKIPGLRGAGKEIEQGKKEL